MSDPDPARHAAQYRLDRDEERRAAEQGEAATPEDAATPAPATAAGRMQYRAMWVDRQIEEAMARGEFDDLPLAGKPIPGLTRYDPDWWLKSLVEREKITGVLPEALQLRTDDAALEERLDRERYEPRVREIVEELNARIVAARRQLQGGPPVVTPTRDVEVEVRRWRERRLGPVAETGGAGDGGTGAGTPVADPAGGARPSGRRGWWRRVWSGPVRED